MTTKTFEGNFGQNRFYLNEITADFDSTYTVVLLAHYYEQSELFMAYKLYVTPV